jgi:hypothetical protein
MARNYVQENVYKSKPEQIEKRVARNAARREMVAKVGKAAVAGKEIHHVNGKTSDNSPANLKAVKPAVHNHGRAGSQGGKLKGGK